MRSIFSSFDRPQLVGSLLALAATAAWSGNFIAAKIVSPHLPTSGMVFWRWLMATLCLLPFGIGQVRAHWREIRPALPLLAFYGFIGMTLANMFYYEAPKTASAVNTVILAAIAPLFMMVYARILFGEAFTKRRLLGSFIALLGVALLVTKGHLSELAHLSLTPGDFWTLAGAGCFALYSVSLRWFKAAVPVPAFLLMVFFFGLLWSTPLYAWHVAGHGLPLPDKRVVRALLYIGIVASALAFFCWSAAIARIGAVRAGIIYYLLPVFGAAEAVWVLRESLDMAQVGGGLLILGGVVFSSLPARLPGRSGQNPAGSTLAKDGKGETG